MRVGYIITVGMTLKMRSLELLEEAYHMQNFWTNSDGMLFTQKRKNCVIEIMWKCVLCLLLFK